MPMAASRDVIPALATACLIASTTAAESLITPSAMASGGNGALAKAVSVQPPARHGVGEVKAPLSVRAQQVVLVLDGAPRQALEEQLQTRHRPARSDRSPRQRRQLWPWRRWFHGDQRGARGGGVRRLRARG